MPEPILVAIAWPYANAEIHVGNLTGSHLPGDIFARYNRLRGRDVAMVSGSDSHGTPVTIKADAEGKTALAVAKRYHEGFLESASAAGHHLRPLHHHPHPESLFRLPAHVPGA